MRRLTKNFNLKVGFVYFPDFLYFPTYTPRIVSSVFLFLFNYINCHSSFSPLHLWILRSFLERLSASPSDTQTPFVFPGNTGAAEARNIFYEQQLARKEKDMIELRFNFEFLFPQNIWNFVFGTHMEI